jgi:hypothetical protein
MVSAVHAAMLGFLTTGVLGALHQFEPVVGNRPLRSTRLAAVTLATFLPGVWTLAGGFAHGPSWLVPAGGAAAVAGLLSHLVSLIATIRARRRRMELLHGFVATSAGFLGVGVMLGVAAVLLPMTTTWRVRLVVGEVLALAA